MINENIHLKDLGQLVDEVRSKIDDDIENEDLILSKEFKKAFERYIVQSGGGVRFGDATTTITSSGNLKIYMPNQWFLLAAYAVDLLKEIVRYRNNTEAMIDTYLNDFTDDSGKSYEKKEIYKAGKRKRNSVSKLNA